MKKILAVVAVVLIVAAAVATIHYRRSAAPVAPAPVPAPAAQIANDKVVLASGWSEAELRKIMEDFCKMYGVPPAFELGAHPTAAGVLRVTFPHDIEPALYFYLVNYVRYPKDFDLGDREIAVLGRATLDDTFALPEFLRGKRAFTYVPADDQNFDLVYMYVLSIGVYQHSLGEGTAWTRVDADRMSREVRALIDVAS